MKYLIVCSLCLFFTSLSLAESVHDSLRQVIETTEDESVKVQATIRLIKYYKHKDLEKLRQCALELYQLEFKGGPAYPMAMSQYYLAYYYRYNGMYNQADSFLDHVVEYGVRSEDASMVISGKTNKAIILSDQGKFKEAINIYIECLKISNEPDVVSNKIVLNNNIGLIYETITEPERALDYYYKGFDAAKEQNSTYNINLLSGNIANIYIGLNQLDSALFYATICRDVSVEHAYHSSVLFSDYLFANIYKKKGELIKALNFASKAAKSYEDMGRKVMFINASHLQGQILVLLKKYDEAISVASKVLNTAKETNNINGISTNHKILSEAYEKKGNTQQALSHFKDYKIMYDSITNSEQKKDIAELELKHESAVKDAQISSQKLELEKQTTSRNYLLAGLIGTAILLFLSFLVFLYRQRSAKKELQLKQERINRLEQTKKIEAMDNVLRGQEDERKRIAKDLHDGLGGLLATARLQLQSLQNKSELNGASVHKAEQIIENAYAEVRRISHDMMPSALTNLGLVAAVEDLADKINSAKNVKVITQFYIKNIKIDEQKQIAIYRIIQEALNNALKHAKAQQVVIQMIENDQNLHLTIEDDGVGFENGQLNAKKGMGLKNVTSRVEYIGGTVSIDSKLGDGVSIDVVIPV